MTLRAMPGASAVPSGDMSRHMPCCSMTSGANMTDMSDMTNMPMQTMPAKNDAGEEEERGE
jgi:hypothetical protein